MISIVKYSKVQTSVKNLIRARIFVPCTSSDGASYFTKFHENI